MAIRLVCECGRKLSAPESAAGLRARCPECGAQHVVPHPPSGVLHLDPDPPPTVRYNSISVVNEARVVNGVGVASLIFGVMALLICWVPLLGLLSWPLAGFALLLGALAVIVAACDGKSGFGSAIGGIVSGLFAIGLSFVITGATGAALVGHKAKPVAHAKKEVRRVP